MTKKLFVAFLLSCLPIFPQALVGHAAVAGNSVTGTTAPINDTGANFWAMCMPTYTGNDGGASNISITDACNGVGTGATWTPSTYYASAADSGVRQWHTSGSTGCALHTFTVSSVNSAAIYFIIAEASFSGMVISGVVDSTASPSADVGVVGGAVSSVNSGSSTPSSGASRLLVSCMGGDASLTPVSINGGFTITDFIDWVNSLNYAGALAYKIVPNGGAVYNPLWSLGATAMSVEANLGVYQGATSAATNSIPIIMEK